MPTAGQGEISITITLLLVPARWHLLDSQSLIFPHKIYKISCVFSLYYFLLFEQLKVFTDCCLKLLNTLQWVIKTKILNFDLFANSVVPKLFWNADHLKYFSAPRSTTNWFLWGLADQLSSFRGPPVVRRADFGNHCAN